MHMLVNMPPALALFLSSAGGWTVHDVVLTKEEIQGLMAGLLVSQASPRGRTRLSEWIGQHAHLLGRSYASELARHFRGLA